MMQNKYRFTSAVLAVLTVLSVFTCLCVSPISVYAADSEEEVDYTKYYTTAYATPEEKLATMELRISNDNYALYVDAVSAEVAILNRHTGQITFSNPYNIARSSGTAAQKAQLMSQLIVTYIDNGTERIYDSFTEAVSRGQVKVKNLRSGIRVEYSIGRENSTRLVPRVISKESFENNILANIPSNSRAYRIMLSYYKLFDQNDPKLSASQKASMLAQYPITAQTPVYAFDTGSVNDRVLTEIEGYITRYCPDYGFEQLEADHAAVNYVNQDSVPALFKIALEYYLEDDGLRVRLPASGIRFDESLFTLSSIQVLPYFGCGFSADLNDATRLYDGYLFLPDGSGALLNFSDISSAVSISGTVYGPDQAYNTLIGANAKNIYWPVFGAVQTITSNGAGNVKGDVTSSGYMALIQEGESLTTISGVSGGKSYNYNTAYATFSPRPRDSYDLSTVVSGVAAGSMVTVVSERKYSGNLMIKYFLLSDEKLSQKDDFSKQDSYYEASYMGMVKAMRKYLYDNNILNRLDTDKVQEDIPLFIESFGSVKTEKRILTFPVYMQTALTSFDNLNTMSESLRAAGITNLNYKLTGFFNGGLISSVPYKVKVQKVLGGKKGFLDFSSYAEENGIGVYPDFDFAYANLEGAKNFDGLSYRKHLAKTIDNRYAIKRDYTSIIQSYSETSYLAISPSFYSYFYDKFQTNYSKLSPSGISVSTLGYALNSDFDEKDSYHREDAKESTIKLLERIKEDYGSVMLEQGNLYTIGYADKILNVALDSSQYKVSKVTIPFIGMVLHGNVEFTGSAINMSGDTDYDILKAIENGAGMYFTLSYQNTSELKKLGDLSKYYSVAFDIWLDDVVKYYNELNDAIADCQTSLITGHEFLVGERVTESTADDTSDYTVNNSKIVKVTYENGVSFILNYNNYTVRADGHEIGALGYVRIG